MVNLNEIFAIISAHKAENTDHKNTMNHEQLGFFLSVNGLHIKEIGGCYKDIKEVSYLVTGTPHKYGWPLNSICSAMAKAYGQDSYTICDGTGQALLMANDGETVINRFTSVKKSSPTDMSYVDISGERFTLTNEE